MSQKLPNMLESTIQKIREMLDVNTVVGTPITTPDGVTIIPVSKVSVGFGGGGSDFSGKTASQEMPFGGGVGGGVVDPGGLGHHIGGPDGNDLHKAVHGHAADNIITHKRIPFLALK